MTSISSITTSTSKIPHNNRCTDNYHFLKSSHYLKNILIFWVVFLHGILTRVFYNSYNLICVVCVWKNSFKTEDVCSLFRFILNKIQWNQRNIQFCGIIIQRKASFFPQTFCGDKIHYFSFHLSHNLKVLATYF